MIDSTGLELDSLKFDHILLMSSQRTIDGVNKALVQVLVEVSGVYGFRFYINTGHNHNSGFLLLAHSDHEFKETDDIYNLTQYDKFHQAPCNETGAYFPVLWNDRFYACVITSPNLTETIDSQIVCLLALYGNIVNLITDSKTDGLTGLLNRKSFDIDLHREVSLAGAAKRRRTDGKVATTSQFLALIDIDFFKRVNDEFGHLIGDEVLLVLGQMLKTSFREHDGLYRYGGEEFAIILRDVSADSANIILNRFSDLIREKVFPTVNQITISIGYTIIDNNSPSNVIELADKALYFSKENGRDLVSDFQLLEQQGKLAKTQINSDIELF